MSFHNMETNQFYMDYAKKEVFHFYSVMTKASPTVTGSNSYFRKVLARLIYYSYVVMIIFFLGGGMDVGMSRKCFFFDIETHAFKRFPSFKYRIKMPDRVSLQ